LYSCKCGERDPNKYYGHKKSMCGNCHNEYTIRVGREKKAYARGILGDKCVSCSFDKYPECLDIHHLDPTVKDTNFRSMRGWSLSRIDKEIKGCVLLCKNCHTAYHSGYDVNWAE